MTTDRPALPASPRFSGERLMPYLSDEIDHMLQYGLKAYALKMYQFIASRGYGKHILDVGCGTGYGTVSLYEHSEGKTWGTDIAHDIVDFAARYYPSLAAQLVVSDSLHLALASHQFDVVSAVEVIEHVRSGDAFLAELVRVMRPDGTCFLSTPNHDVVAPHAATSNPFHTKEYNYDEFLALLQRFFEKVELFCVHIHNRIFLVRYVKAALRFTPPFPLAHIERYLYWHVPPWNRAQVYRSDVEITSRFSPRCFGLFAMCSQPRQA